MLISKNCVLKSLKDLPDNFTFQDLEEQIAVFNKVEAELQEVKKLHQNPMEELRTKILQSLQS